MTRPLTLFTGQWADLPLAELAPLAKRMGYDGLELACWGDHFNVREALESPRYVADKRVLLADHGLQCLDFDPAAGLFDAVFDKKNREGMAA